jgi:hypothetical protein
MRLAQQVKMRNGLNGIRIRDNMGFCDGGDEPWSPQNKEILVKVPNVAAECVAPLLYIREFPASNLGSETD